MIHRKVKASAKNLDFPNSMDKLIGALDFNAISLSINPTRKVKDNGYIVPETKYRAKKIWSIANDWQRLIVGGNSPKSIRLTMVVHRIIGSKEAVNLLHRSGSGISYTDVMRETKILAQDTRHDSKISPATIPKGKPTHVTIDNSDGRQQTLTGLATTHHTNSTVYAPSISIASNINSFVMNTTTGPEMQDDLSPSKEKILRRRDCVNDYKLSKPEQIQKYH